MIDRNSLSGSFNPLSAQEGFGTAPMANMDAAMGSAPVDMDSGGQLINEFSENLIAVITARLGFDSGLEGYNRNLNARTPGPGGGTAPLTNNTQTSGMTASAQPDMAGPAASNALPFASAGTAVHQVTQEYTSPATQMDADKSLQAGSAQDITQDINTRIDVADQAMKEIAAAEKDLRMDQSAAMDQSGSAMGSLSSMAVGTALSFVPIVGPAMMIGAAARTLAGAGTHTTINEPSTNLSRGRHDFSYAADSGYVSRPRPSMAPPADPLSNAGGIIQPIQNAGIKDNPLAAVDQGNVTCVEDSLAGIEKIKLNVQHFEGQALMARYDFDRWSGNVEATTAKALQDGAINHNQAREMTEQGDMDIASAARSGPIPHKMAAAGIPAF